MSNTLLHNHFGMCYGGNFELKRVAPNIVEDHPTRKHRLAARPALGPRYHDMWCHPSVLAPICGILQGALVQSPPLTDLPQSRVPLQRVEAILVPHGLWPVWRYLLVSHGFWTLFLVGGGVFLGGWAMSAARRTYQRLPRLPLFLVFGSGTTRFNCSRVKAGLTSTVPSALVTVTGPHSPPGFSGNLYFPRVRPAPACDERPFGLCFPIISPSSCIVGTAT